MYGGRNMAKIMIMDHPLIQHKIGIIRQATTGTKDFRQLIKIGRASCGERV